MAYMTNSINNTATITKPAGAAITAGAGKLVKYDGSGNIILCSVSGERAIGVLALDTPDSVASGEYVTVNIKDIVLMKSGAAFAIGAEIQTDANAKAITAVSTKCILGEAMEAAGAADVFVPVQITKSGYKA